MATVTFIDSDETINVVEVEPGENIMTLAVNNMVEGIVGECGGALSCATCHCYLDEQFSEHFQPVSEMEEAMLEMVVDRKASSRLSCQLELTEDTPDITVRLPDNQY